MSREAITTAPRTGHGATEPTMTDPGALPHTTSTPPRPSGRHGTAPSTPATTTPPTEVLLPGRPAHRRGLILGIVLIAQLMEVLDTSIVDIALPDMARALHFSPSSLSWVINAYTLAFGGLLLLGARTGDILGRRRVFVTGIALFSIASLAGGFATTGGALLIARVVQGVGAAFAAPSALAILMTLFPEARERTRALGWFAAVSVGGAAIGLIAGGMLTQWASWRWVMFVNVPIGAALVVGILAVVPRFARTHGRFDLTGALTSTAGVTAVVYALVRAASTRWDDPLVLLGLAGGGLLLTAFVLTERHAEAPITPLRLFVNRNRSASYLVRLLMSAGMFGMFFFLTQFVQEIWDYSPLQAGIAFLPLTVVLFAASMLTARALAPRLSGRTLMLMGLTLATAALLAASSLDTQSPYVALLVTFVLFGAGAGLTFVPMTALSLDGVAQSDAGAASGLVNVSQQVGGALGLAVLVSVFGHAPSPATSGVTGAALEATRQAFVAGADRALLVGAAMMAAAVLLTAALIRRPAVAAADPALSGDGETRELVAT